MTHKTIRNGSALIVQTPEGRSLFLTFADEASADAVQKSLKNIDTVLQGRRLELYGDAFGDGALGVTNETFL